MKITDVISGIDQGFGSGRWSLKSTYVSDSEFVRRQRNATQFAEVLSSYGSSAIKGKYLGSEPASTCSNPQRISSDEQHSGTAEQNKSPEPNIQERSGTVVFLQNKLHEASHSTDPNMPSNFRSEIDHSGTGNVPTQHSNKQSTMSIGKSPIRPAAFNQLTSVPRDKPVKIELKSRKAPFLRASTRTAEAKRGSHPSNIRSIHPQSGIAVGRRQQMHAWPGGPRSELESGHMQHMKAQPGRPVSSLAIERKLQSHTQVGRPKSALAPEQKHHKKETPSRPQSALATGNRNLQRALNGHTVLGEGQRTTLNSRDQVNKTSQDHSIAQVQLREAVSPAAELRDWPIGFQEAVMRLFDEGGTPSVRNLHSAVTLYSMFWSQPQHASKRSLAEQVGTCILQMCFTPENYIDQVRTSSSGSLHADGFDDAGETLSSGTRLMLLKNAKNAKFRVKANRIVGNVDGATNHLEHVKSRVPWYARHAQQGKRAQRWEDRREVLQQRHLRLQEALDRSAEHLWHLNEQYKGAEAENAAIKSNVKALEEKAAALCQELDAARESAQVYLQRQAQVIGAFEEEANETKDILSRASAIEQRNRLERAAQSFNKLCNALCSLQITTGQSLRSQLSSMTMQNHRDLRLIHTGREDEKGEETLQWISTASPEELATRWISNHLQGQGRQAIYDFNGRGFASHYADLIKSISQHSTIQALSSEEPLHFQVQALFTPQKCPFFSEDFYDDCGTVHAVTTTTAMLTNTSLHFVGSHSWDTFRTCLGELSSQIELNTFQWLSKARGNSALFGTIAESLKATLQLSNKMQIAWSVACEKLLCMLWVGAENCGARPVVSSLKKLAGFDDIDFQEQGYISVDGAAFKEQIDQENDSLYMSDPTTITGPLPDKDKESSLLRTLQQSSDAKFKAVIDRISTTFAMSGQSRAAMSKILFENRQLIRGVFRYYRSWRADGVSIGDGNSKMVSLDALEMFAHQCRFLNASFPKEIFIYACKSEMHGNHEALDFGGFIRCCFVNVPCLKSMADTGATTDELRALCGNIVYGRPTGAPQDRLCPSAKSTSQFMTKFVAPFAHQTPTTLFKELVQRGAIAQLLDQLEVELLEVFAYYSDSGHGDTDRTMINISEFITFLTDCEVIGQDITHEQIVDIFCGCQDDEDDDDGEEDVALVKDERGQAMPQIDHEMENNKDDNDEEMSFEEFKCAVCACALYYTPNPFISTAAKIRKFLRCVVLRRARRRKSSV